MKYRLEQIVEIVMAFSEEKEYMKLLDVILTKMMEMTKADAGTLYILENETLYFGITRNNSLGIYKSSVEGNGLPPIKLDPDNINNVSAYTALKNEIVVIDDVYESTRFNFSGPKRYDEMTGYRTRSMLTMPLSATFDSVEEVTGVIQLINASDESGKAISFGNVFDPPILPALANIAANTLANVMYANEIKGLFKSFITVMTGAIDERSAYNSNHTHKVAEYCNAFACYLGKTVPPGHELHFDDLRREKLVMAALLHDIGKIITQLEIMDKADRLGMRSENVRYKFALARLQAENGYLVNKYDKNEYEKIIGKLSDALNLIEECNTVGFLTDEKIECLKEVEKLTYTSIEGAETSILTHDEMEAITIRKGTLTDRERKVMQEHASLTGRFLKSMGFDKYYKEVPAWARNHHEFLDGSGYPEHLTGEDIDLETRILTIMDIYEALTAGDRPYKKAISRDNSLKILRSMADEGKLDARLVTMFEHSGIN